MFIPPMKPITQKRLEQIKKGRGTNDYQIWRSKVLERDDNKCQFPGCSCCEKLEIHHIRRWTDAKHLRKDVINGITLCEKHHSHITGQEKSWELILFKIALANKNKKEKKDEHNS